MAAAEKFNHPRAITRDKTTAASPIKLAPNPNHELYSLFRLAASPISSAPASPLRGMCVRLQVVLVMIKELLPPPGCITNPHPLAFPLPLLAFPSRLLLSLSNVSPFLRFLDRLWKGCRRPLFRSLFPLEGGVSGLTFPLEGKVSWSSLPNHRARG